VSVNIEFLVHHKYGLDIDPIRVVILSTKVLRKDRRKIAVVVPKNAPEDCDIVLEVLNKEVLMGLGRLQDLTSDADEKINKLLEGT
jgi:hypothetical protein